MHDNGEIYIKVEHPAYGSIAAQPSEFIGPFPDTDIAVKHRLLYGPLLGVVSRVSEPPAPEQTMTPGQAVDYVLTRY